MICDDCKYLVVRDKYKIVCEINEHQLLDVKQCMNFEKKEEE